MFSGKLGENDGRAPEVKPFNIDPKPIECGNSLDFARMVITFT